MIAYKTVQHSFVRR